jgi:hypothetical protein
MFQLSDDAATILAARREAPSRHVIIDEGQDLHPAQWRLLRVSHVGTPSPFLHIF